MRYPDEIIEEIRSANDIVDVISSYVKLEKRGSSWFGLCPFHSEKTPSFSVSRAKQMYYCFGCHSGGNVITFIMQYENFTFEEAIRYLADRVGIKLPEIKISNQSKAEADLKMKLLEIHKTAANYYYHILVSENGKAGLEYFRKRGLSDATIRNFGLGYTGIGSDKLYKMLKSKGYDDTVLKESGLVTIEEKGAHDKFWNRVMFPLMDVNNKVIGFGGRVLGDGMPKYMNSPETKIFEKNRFLFGLNYARKSRKDYFFLCEGNMDVIAMHQAGYTNAVASLGTSLTSNQPLIIKRYVDKVILTYDSDEAGINAAQRAIPMLNDAGISVKILNLSPAKDPDEFLSRFGTDELDKRIAAAENSFIWSIGVIRSKYDMNDPQQKTEFEHKTAELLCEFSEALERDNYTRAVASKYMIPYADLKKLVNSVGNKGYGKKDIKPVYEPAKLKKADEGLMKTQAFIISAVSGDESIKNQIVKYLNADDFDGELYKDLFERIANGQDSASIFNEYTDDKERSDIIAGILNYNSGAISDDYKNALAAAIVRIKQSSIDRKIKDAADIQSLQSNMKEQGEWKNKKIVLK
ncbi:MAG: DNA primase [Lachnospiraceae bacterium]|nr:DNA primase [Lachnospiraceae bacterium]